MFDINKMTFLRAGVAVVRCLDQIIINIRSHMIYVNDNVSDLRNIMYCSDSFSADYVNNIIECAALIEKQYCITENDLKMFGAIGIKNIASYHKVRIKYISSMVINEIFAILNGRYGRKMIHEHFDAMSTLNVIICRILAVIDTYADLATWFGGDLDKLRGVKIVEYIKSVLFVINDDLREKCISHAAMTMQNIAARQIILSDAIIEFMISMICSQCIVCEYDAAKSYDTMTPHHENVQSIKKMLSIITAFDQDYVRRDDVVLSYRVMLCCLNLSTYIINRILSELNCRPKSLEIKLFRSFMINIKYKCCHCIAAAICEYNQYRANGKIHELKKYPLF